MIELQIQQKIFLRSTIEWYKVNPRGMRNHAICSYEKGCAIGRHLPVNLCKILDKNNPSVHSISDRYSYLWEVFPNYLKDLGIDFLQEVQSLHDSNAYWFSTKKGNKLSNSGLNCFMKIQDQFGLL